MKNWSQYPVLQLGGIRYVELFTLSAVASQSQSQLCSVNEAQL